MKAVYDITKFLNSIIVYLITKLYLTTYTHIPSRWIAHGGVKLFWVKDANKVRTKSYALLNQQKERNRKKGYAHMLVGEIYNSFQHLE